MTSTSLLGDPWTKRTSPCPVHAKRHVVLLVEQESDLIGRELVVAPRVDFRNPRIHTLLNAVALRDLAIRIPTDEIDKPTERHHALHHLPGLRPPGEIDAEHHRVYAGAFDLLQDRIQSRQVAMDIVQSCNFGGHLTDHLESTHFLHSRFALSEEGRTTV